MAKHLAITLLIIALVLCSSTARAARPDPSFTSAVKSIPSGTIGEAKDEVKAIDEDQLESCDGKTNEEECLMRRTMIAHVDYIYTQSHHRH